MESIYYKNEIKQIEKELKEKPIKKFKDMPKDEKEYFLAYLIKKRKYLAGESARYFSVEYIYQIKRKSSSASGRPQSNPEDVLESPPRF